MEIVFLGTGAGEGMPGFRCECPACIEAREKKGKYIRQNSAVYIKTDSGINVLIDMPPQIKPLLEINNIDDTALDLLLISHYHSDHTNGIFHLLDAKPSSGHEINKTMDVYMPEDCYKTVFEYFYIDQPDLSKIDYEKFYTLNKQKDLEWKVKGALRFQALKTNHLIAHSGRPYKRECHGYLFSENGKNIAYMVDASNDLPESTIKALKSVKLDCLIYECTFDVRPESNKGHSDIPGVLKIRELFNPDYLIITHISHRNYGHDKLTDFMNEHDIDVAWDGRKITV